MNQIELYRYGMTDIDGVILRVPTLDEICNVGELKIFSTAALICAIPTDFMSELDELGIRYEDVAEYDFFLIYLLPNIREEDLNMLLPNVHPSKMKYIPADNGAEGTLFDPDNQVTISKQSYITLTRTLRKIFGFSYQPRFAQNELTRKKMLEYAQRKRKKKLPRDKGSSLLPLISALVNCADFKYNFENVWNMNFYAFMDSVKRVNAVRSANQMSTGGYFGIKLAEVKEHLDWMRPL